MLVIVQNHKEVS